MKHRRKIRKGGTMEAHSCVADLAPLDDIVRITRRREGDLADIRLAPCLRAWHILQHQCPVRWRGLLDLLLCLRVAQIGHSEIEKTKPHPTGLAKLRAAPAPRLLNFSIELGMTDFAPTSDNGISKVLPDDRDKFSGRLVPASDERRGPAYPDHRVATSGQPVDIGHMVEF